jgi:CRISPR-associated protein Cmr2
MNYIAYTIGPIYDTIFDTLNDDNKTKKLKAGSYFFSYFMKTLLLNIKDEFDILVPFVEGDILQKEFKNIGIFHDRFIASSDKPKQEIKDIFLKKLNKTYQDIAKNKADILKQNMTNHLIVVNELELKKIDSNIIFALNKILDSKELNRDFVLDKEESFIQQYQQEQINQLGKVKNLGQISGDFNYYAIITADGDKMGAKIKELATNKPQNIKQISKSLYEFFTSKDNIYNITKNYGGELIYAGGDDILAFLPVKKDNMIFLDYIKEIDDRFRQIVGNDVSLSFGINIAYKKYPLRDAIKTAFNLLYSAKSYGSNSVAINTTKHSGQRFSNIFNLKSDEFKKYKELTQKILNNTITLPHSFHHSLKRYETAIISLYQQNRTIDNLFDTIFNDAKLEKDQKGIDTVKEYINIVKPTTNKQFDHIFFALSMVKFLREDRK